MTHEEQLLVSLLKRALNPSQNQNQIEGKFKTQESASVWHSALKMADAHAILPLLYDVLQPVLPQMNQSDRGLLQRSTLTCSRQYYYLNYLTANIQQALDKAGIQTAVFKGISAASCYPVPAYRKSGDIDFLLLRPSDKREQGTFPAAQLQRAEEVLRQMGYDKAEKQTTTYHIVYTKTNSPDVELHTFLSEPFENAHVNEIIQEIQDDGLLGLQRITTEGSKIWTFSEAGTAFSLLIHMLHHFVRSGFGLKLLADWTVFWNRHPKKNDPAGKEYLKLTRQCGIDGFSDTVTGVCKRYFGLCSEAVSDDLADDALCQDFLTDILESMEFGYEDNSRMVALQGSGPLGYIREFHHRMKLNYPEASKHILLYPFLWAGTLGRFLMNNHTVRHTSLRSILKNAGARGKMSRRMNLFKIEK